MTMIKIKECKENSTSEVVVNIEMVDGCNEM